MELPPLIPREVLFGNPEKTGPQISPDGTKLAYLAPSDGVLNVWVRSVGHTNDRAVTRDTLRGIRAFFWQPGDSAHLLYLQDTGGDENFHLYQTEIESEQTEDLTPFAGARAVPLALPPNIPGRMLVSLNHRDPRVFDVYNLDLTTRALTLTTENPGDVASFAADNALEVRAAQVQLPDGSTEIRVPDGAGGWRVFLTWDADETGGGVSGFSPDNSKIWVINSVGANVARLLEVDLATAESTVIAEDPDFDVSGILRHPQTRALEAVQFTRARQEWTAVDPALQADFEILEAVTDGDWSITSRDLADTHWVVSYVRDTGPTRFYLYNRTTKTAAFLFSSQPALENYTLAPMTPVTFPARDGLALSGYLTLPVGVEPKALPLVLLVHGGPWARDVWGYSATVQMLANRGYGVLQINFRGSSGYGKAHLNAGDREWGAKMHTDLLDGKLWAIAEGYADPEKVAIMGGSYGGYATLAGLAFTPEEFVCGVDIVGPSNLLTLLQTIPPYWSTLVATFYKRMGRLDEPDFLQSRSPLFSAGRITKPLLIAQGANDPRVKQAESDQIVAAMRERGLPVEYIVFPDEGHGFARPENNRKFIAAAEAFLARYLGGRAEPPSPEENVDDLRQ